MRRLRRVRRTRSGMFEVSLPDEERALLRALPGQVRELLAADDPSVFRLFPSAYPTQPELDQEYTQLTRDDLLSHHLASLETLEATVDATRLDEDQLSAWLGALNQLRLVLGTRLEISEEDEEVDPDDPRAPAFVVYHYLTFLQGQVIDALAR